MIGSTPLQKYDSYLYLHVGLFVPKILQLLFGSHS